MGNLERLCIWLCLLVLVCAHEADAQVPRSPLGGIVTVGDSITQGSVSSPAGTSEDGTSWTEVVEARFPGRVRNAGCNSATSASVLYRFGETHVGAPCLRARSIKGESEWDVLIRPRLSFGARWVVVMLGAGDALFTGFCDGTWSPCDPAQESAVDYRANLEDLVDLVEAEAPEATVVLVAAPAFGAGDPIPGANALLADYAVEVAALCAADARVACGPDLSDLLKAAHYSGGDILHPNEAGHALIGDAIGDAIEALE